MKLLKYITDNTLLIVPNNIKLNILDSFNNNSKLFLENQVKEVVLKLKKESEKKGIKA